MKDVQPCSQFPVQQDFQRLLTSTASSRNSIIMTTSPALSQTAVVPLQTPRTSLVSLTKPILPASPAPTEIIRSVPVSALVQNIILSQSFKVEHWTNSHDFMLMNKERSAIINLKEIQALPFNLALRFFDQLYNYKINNK